MIPTNAEIIEAVPIIWAFIFGSDGYLFSGLIALFVIVCAGLCLSFYKERKDVEFDNYVDSM